jgi:hypothetical protein
MTLPIELREGYEEDHRHPLVAALREFVASNKLAGVVLISFSDTKVGVTVSSPSRRFGEALQPIADDILRRIDDGDFDPSLTH